MCGLQEAGLFGHPILAWERLLAQTWNIPYVLCGWGPRNRLWMSCFGTLPPGAVQGIDGNFLGGGEFKSAPFPRYIKSNLGAQQCGNAERRRRLVNTSWLGERPAKL